MASAEIRVSLPELPYDLRNGGNTWPNRVEALDRVMNNSADPELFAALTVGWQRAGEAKRGSKLDVEQLATRNRAKLIFVSPDPDVDYYSPVSELPDFSRTRLSPFIAVEIKPSERYDLVA